MVPTEATSEQLFLWSWPITTSSSRSGARGARPPSTSAPGQDLQGVPGSKVARGSAHPGPHRIEGTQVIFLVGTQIPREFRLFWLPAASAWESYAATLQADVFT